MRLLCDDGFPMLELPSYGFVVGALPFTKAQYEKLWALVGCPRNLPQEETPFSDDCYDGCLALNPRPAKQSKIIKPLNFWLTGLSPQHTERLLSHLPNARLPEAQIWLNVEKYLSQKPFADEDKLQWEQLELSEAARHAVRVLWEQKKPYNWAQATALQDGILEWVKWQQDSWDRNASDVGALGSPQGTSFVPQLDGPRRHSATDQPDGWNGFRVWKTL